MSYERRCKSEGFAAGTQHSSQSTLIRPGRKKYILVELIENCPVRIIAIMRIHHEEINSPIPDLQSRLQYLQCRVRARANRAAAQFQSTDGARFPPVPNYSALRRENDIPYRT